MFSRALFFAVSLAVCASVRAEDPSTFEVGGLKFTRPAEWKWVPVNSPMRKAQLQVPGADASKAAEMTFFNFGLGGAGGVDANVQRWFKQFSGKPDAEKKEALEVDGKTITIVTTEGTFASGMPGGAEVKPLENYALLGAIVEAPEGLVFVKMTGPIETVKASREKFISFVKSALGAKS
jgi:hypothetical protein